MSNWCDNKLMVSGSDPEVKRFRDLARPAPGKHGAEHTDLSLNALYPLPGAGVGNWNGWCTQHWGTKWDVQAVLDTDAEGYLVYLFESAWVPPVAWLERVSRKFPTLKFQLRYDEPDQGFLGVAKAEAGIVRDDAVSYF